MHLLELQPLVSWFRLRMHGRVWVESAFWYRQWLGYNYQRGPHICCLQGLSLHILEVISCWSFRFPCLQLQMYIYPWNVQALRDCYCFAQINMNKSSEREREGGRERPLGWCFCKLGWKKPLACFIHSSISTRDADRLLILDTMQEL